MIWPSFVISAFHARECPRPGTWRAKCPVHGDRTPSLGIWMGRRHDRLIVRCWARRERCPIESIVSAVGLKMGDLFKPDDNDGPYRRERQYKDVPPPQFVCSYPYHDEAGRLLYEVVRFHPKDFKQRRPDGSGGWIWGLGDTRRVLFRLPQIVERAQQPVIIVEGEKDVLVLESLGLLASCNPGGTGMGWLDSYSESLKGRRCVVIPDTDDSGRTHADRVAGSLLRAGVESLRLVLLPGAKDVAEWVMEQPAAVDARAELVRLIRAAREWHG